MDGGLLARELCGRAERTAAPGWRTAIARKHVLRGGSWDNVPVFVRSAARSGSGPDGGEFDYSSLAGFRVARDLP